MCYELLSLSLFLFYLGEVANKMAASLVIFREDVEQEWLHLKVKSFVVQEQFGEEAEILTVLLSRNETDTKNLVINSTSL